MSQQHYDLVRASGGVLDRTLPPSPYPCPIKCYVTWSWRIGSWTIIGHRWGDVPYHVGHRTEWLKAVLAAQDHVRAGGLSWEASPKPPTPPPDQPRPGDTPRPAPGPIQPPRPKTKIL